MSGRNTFVGGTCPSSYYLNTLGSKDHQTCRGKDGQQMGIIAGDEELLGRRMMTSEESRHLEHQWRSVYQLTIEGDVIKISVA